MSFLQLLLQMHAQEADIASAVEVTAVLLEVTEVVLAEAIVTAIEVIPIVIAVRPALQ